MMSDTTPTCTAFVGHQRVAFGPYAAVAEALARRDLSLGGLLVFDDATGALVDHPWPADHVPAQADCAVKAVKTDEAVEPAPAAAPSVGRPRMGVVAREVTLLPRHWEWLAQQRGGASAALRRLVEEARRSHAERDAVRRAKERSYRFMSAMGGGLPGFEEASRALFAHDGGVFAERVAHWPPDVRAYLAWLSRDAFESADTSERASAANGPA